jgi:ribonuclease BN (tRNA processing enzyme)
MQSSISFHQLTTPVLVDGITVDSIPLDHGQNNEEGVESHCFALRFTNADGKKFVVATDHEARPSEINNKLIEFAKEADLLVHDAQYTQEEYKPRVGWGHSTFAQAVENAKKSNAKKVLLTHHHPQRTDSEIDEIAQKIKSDPRFSSVDFEFAKEFTSYGDDD